MAHDTSKASRGNNPNNSVTPTVNITSHSISVSGFYDSGDWKVQAGLLKKNGVVKYRFEQQGEVNVEPGQYVHDVEGLTSGTGFMSSNIEYNFTS